MRLIGELDNENLAKVFCDSLTGLKIENQITDESTAENKIYEIWVKWEDDMPKATQLFAEFLANPNDPKYRGVAREARKVNRQKAAQESDQIPHIDVRSEVFNQPQSPKGGFTMLLILACVVIGVLSQMGQKTGTLRMLFITDFLREGEMVRWMPGLVEIGNGEIWRLFTPIFIHFGFMHLLFNMMWLMDLGSMIEYRKGTLFFILFVLVVAGSSNYGQYIFGKNPAFGGMSGVVYGLLGYIWMKGKYDPASKLSLHTSTVTFMIIWYFLCLTGLMGNIANAAHTVGLVVGMAWGYFTSFKARRIAGKIK